MRGHMILALFAVLLLFSSGCLKMDIYETINSDGSSDRKVSMDLSAMPEEYLEGSDVCGEMSESDYLGTMDCEMTGCEMVDSVVTMTAHCEEVSPSSDLAIEPGLLETTYTYTFGREAATDSSYSGTEASQLKAMGLEINYYLKMPGGVVSTSYGEIVNGSIVKIDMIELALDRSTNEVTVVSKEVNLLVYAVIIVAILVVIFLVMHRKK